MDRTSWILLTVFSVGLLILILPDHGRPVFRFNKVHGPSLADLAGLLLILGSWLACFIIIIKRWKLVITRLSKNNVYLGVGLYFIFLSGIVTALLLIVEWMLWVCVAGASMINLAFIVFAFSAKKQTAG